MKILRLLIITLCLLCLLPLNVPFGEGAYAVNVPHIVIGKELWLLSSDSSEKLFLLPEGYYAKIENIDVDYYFVTFNGVSGKVEKSKASAIGYHTQATGTMQELTIASEYSDFETIKIHSVFGSETGSFSLKVSDSFLFVGEYPSSELWYYVKCGEKYGYVKADRTSQPSLSLPTFVPETEEAPPVQETKKEDENSDSIFSSSTPVVRILIIIGLCIPVLLLIFLLFKPSKSKKYYYEDK